MAGSVCTVKHCKQTHTTQLFSLYLIENYVTEKEIL